MAGILTQRLGLLITADGKGAIRELQQVGDAADKQLGKRGQSSIDKWSQGLTRGGVAALGFAAVVGRGLLGAANASEDARHSIVELDNTMRNMPLLAHESRDSFLDLAAAIQDKTAADGDQIVSAMAMLGTFSLTGDQMREMTPLVVDYAQKFGVDLVGAATQVGKALDGNITTLKRNGVSIDAALFKTDRYRAVQEALARQVGGFAEAEGATFAGSLARLRNELGDVAEGIGSGVVPAFESMIKPVGAVADRIGEMSPQTQAAIGKFAAWSTATIGLVGALSLTAGQVLKLRDRFTTLGADGTRSITGLGRAARAIGIVGAFTAGIVAVREFGKSLGKADQDIRNLLDGSGKDLLKEFILMAEFGGGGIEKKFREIAGANRALAVRIMEAAEATDWASEETDGFARILGEEDAKARQAAEDNEANADALEATATKAGVASRKIDFLTRSLADLTDQVQESTRSQLDYEGAVDASEEAIREYDRAAQHAARSGGKNKKAVEEWSDAARSAKETILAQGDAAVSAYESAAGGAVSATEKNAILRAEYERLRDTLAPGSPLRQFLEELIARLDEAARPRVASVTIITNGSIPNVGGGALGPVAARQHGGPVKAHRPFLVGETGPELFVPTTSGRIVADEGGRTPVGSVVNVNVERVELIGVRDPDDLVRQLAVWARRNGPLPIRVRAS